MRYQVTVIPLSSQDGTERYKMAKSKKPCFSEDWNASPQADFSQTMANFDLLKTSTT